MMTNGPPMMFKAYEVQMIGELYAMKQKIESTLGMVSRPRETRRDAMYAAHELRRILNKMSERCGVLACALDDELHARSEPKS